MSDTNISNEAVQKATGKGWKHWFALLDEAESTSKTHKEIAAWLSEHSELSGWWTQMITVQYERERGLREVHEKKDGFEAGKSKTFYLPVDKLYQAWIDPAQRKQWLEAPDFEIRTATKNKSIRISWPDETNVVVDFAVKGEAKAQISIQHNKLADKKKVVKWKAYWHSQLSKLDDYLG